MAGKMIIAKKQMDKAKYALHWAYFSSAREGFKRILLSKPIVGKMIFLPAYIGISTKEGSGVFDPIRSTKTRYAFYRLQSDLMIDVGDIKRRIKQNPGNILLLIHYFGFKDKNCDGIKAWARKYDFTIIEDYAHAFYTFWLNPVVDFDYAFFSIHKLFPLNGGGAVLSRGKLKSTGKDRYHLLQYDTKTIIEKRLSNYNFLLKQCGKWGERYNIEVLRQDLRGAVPQTFPVLVANRDLRDQLYFCLNAKGFGVVSLYHELIPEIDRSYKEEHEISDRILNLPVHQDAEKEQLQVLIHEMLEIIRGYKKIKSFNLNAHYAINSRKKDI